MRLPDPFTTATPATAPTAATRPTAALGAAGAGGFGAVYDSLGHSLRQDVQHFIEQGDSGEAFSSAGGLNAEARARLATMNGITPPVAGDSAVPAGPQGPLTGPQQAFLEQLAPLAAEAGARLGVSPHVLAAQAALESGWGQRPLRDAQGADSHNLFGLKAGRGWQGASGDNTTTEYAGGEAVSEVARFRAYDDPSASFKDLTQLLLKAPRYQGALNTGHDALAYGQGLVRGGYATDPAYAAKLARVAGQIRQSRD
ncbi:MAG TPA: glucosaminidase domain-containing protein [Ideonella sp.]|uniref:glycoside hydrolase family 73 protein n=1 Tax=Ideonella sp. TaxID=1929293 RepID=UPI002C7078A8|nr:glucosaminidase domain-containing protein [Ideonella sp.]HSI50159.1 glucosaminidase domain-containing protein [Ideonella sp.]